MSIQQGAENLVRRIFVRRILVRREPGTKRLVIDHREHQPPVDSRLGIAENPGEQSYDRVLRMYDDACRGEERLINLIYRWRSAGLINEEMMNQRVITIGAYLNFSNVVTSWPH